MDEMFDLLIVIIGIIVVVVKAASNSKKVKQNAPGKAAVPKSAAPASPVHNPQPVKTSMHPTVSIPQTPASGQGSFWQQIGDAIQKELGLETDEADHGKKPPMNEGDSRECEHGSVGGSMAYGAHEGGKAVSKLQPVRSAYDKKGESGAAVYRLAMNAQEMRRAVVMAEILKRPQDRMAEQARRWSAR